MATKKAERAVMVTTSHRGVFFGYATETEGDTIDLKRARMVIYWPQDVRGVLGLAVTGPTRGSKITAAVDAMQVRQITAVVEVSTEAVANWEKGIWS